MKKTELKQIIREEIQKVLNEKLSGNDFPKFESYVESLIPKNRRIQFWVEGDRLLIGYFPEYASMADLSKSMPEKVKDSIENYLKN